MLRPTVHNVEISGDQVSDFLNVINTLSMLNKAMYSIYLIAIN